ncbi:MAG: pyruvate dehydrogenase (acetyl-transferring), homodimeric type, partial [Caldimonas sp.]
MTDLSLTRHIGAILGRDDADLDPGETAEWLEALDALTAAQGPDRARFLLDALLAHARRRGVNWQPSLISPYVNSIALEAQTPFPGDLAMEQRLAAL